MLCSDKVLAEDILQRKRGGLARKLRSIDGVRKELGGMNSIVWGVRVFRRQSVDPTSALTPAVSILPAYSDPGAIAMGFSLDSPSQAAVTYTTVTDHAVSRYFQTWEIEGSSVKSSAHITARMEFNPSLDATDVLRGRVMLMLLGMLIVI